MISVITVPSATASAPVIKFENVQNASDGSIIPVAMKLTEAQDGLSGYNITVFVTDSSVAEILSVDFPKWSALSDNGSLPADSVWLKAFDLNNQIQKGSTDILLATLNIKMNVAGAVNLEAKVFRMDDDNGNSIISETPSINESPAISTATSLLTAMPLPDNTGANNTQPAVMPTPVSSPTASYTPETLKETPVKRTTSTQKVPGFIFIISLTGLLFALIFRKRNKI